MPELQSELGRKMARGAAWMIAMRWGMRAATVVSTMVAARILDPSDFGLIAIVLLLVGFLDVCGAFGFERFIIQKQTSDTKYYDSGWTLNVLKGVLIGILLVALAYPASWFFDDQRVVGVTCIFALAAIIGAFESIAIVAFRVRLNFRVDFFYLTGKRVIAATATIIAAVILRNYWALTVGPLVEAAAGTCISFLIAPFRPRFSLRMFREIFDFGKWSMANQFIYYLALQVDNLLVGRFLDKQTLGVYSIAKTIALLPNQELARPISTTFFAGFATLFGDVPRIREMYLGSQALLLAIVWPMSFGLALVAPEFVSVVLGSKWAPSAPIISALSVWGGIGLAWPEVNAIYLAINRPRLTTVSELLHHLPRIVAIVLGMSLAGLKGVICGLLVSICWSYVVNYLMLRRHLGIRIRDVFSRQWRIILALSAMICVVLAFGFICSLSPILALISKIAVGAVSYVVVLMTAWAMSGRPPGPESAIIFGLKKRLRDAPKLATSK